MQKRLRIPTFDLFGEDERFPDLLHCEPFSRRAKLHDWKIEPHRHPSILQLLLIFEGRMAVNIDGHETVLQNNQYLFVPQGIVHSFAFTPNTNGLVLSFASSLLKTIGPAYTKLNEALSTWFIASLEPELRTMIEIFARLGNTINSLVKAQRIGIAHAILAKLALAAPDQTSLSKNQGILAKFDQLISEHLDKGWGASDYANELAMSTGHLSRICRLERGLSATTMIEQKTMDEACRLLAFTNLRVGQIAYQLGFKETTYFSNRFKKAKGETPSSYRTRFIN